MAEGSVVIIGGSSGIGLNLAQHYAGLGRRVVLTSRNPDRASRTAREVGGETSGIALDLAQPKGIRGALAELGHVDHLILAAIERDQNTVKNFDIARAIQIATLKLVGYTEVVHVLADRLTPGSSIVLFGGLAKERPYPGSTMVTTINGGVTSLVRTLAIELAPIRVNAIHPGFVSDTPFWKDKPEALEQRRARTPTGKLATMKDIAHAVQFLLDNPAVNGVNLYVDGGWLLL